MKTNEQNIQASLLDRLVDHEPGTTREPVQYRLTNFGQVKASVIRDLENLLNTKNFASLLSPAYRELDNSLLVYGLPDFTSNDPKSMSMRHLLRQAVEKAITRFEPRLRNVTVVPIDPPATEKRTLRIKITGLLIVDPVAEPVIFDTYLDVNRGEYLIPR